MANVAWICDTSSGDITIYVGATVYSIGRDHCSYDSVKDRLNTKVYDDLEELLDIPAALASASNGKVFIENSSVYYDGKEVHNVLVDRIFDFMNEGLPFEPLTLFLENLLQNPNEDTIEELYLFLESGHMPITEDGCFLAYKKVDEDLNSFHRCPDGSSLNHKIGTVVSMPREEVDMDRNRTCSYGLHFCSLGYLPNFYGQSGRVVIVKINPRDVCAIPSDYSNTKGRASCYEVVEEYDSPNCESEDAFESVYVDTTGDVASEMVHNKSNDDAFVSDGSGGWGIKPDGRKFNNLRGSDGKFRKRS